LTPVGQRRWFDSLDISNASAPAPMPFTSCGFFAKASFRRIA
jgi:hypothetical protein